MGNTKILILGLGAFGFAIAKHLAENNTEQIFFASEVNTEIFESIQATRTHPYFFPGVKLPKNIELVDNTSKLLTEIDIVISVIPCQFVGKAFEAMKDTLKKDACILNLSKGIDNTSLETVSEKLANILGDISYSYAYLAGGMIAEELVTQKKLGADIVTKNTQFGKYLQKLFESNNLDISLKIQDPKNTELYAALKNIVALILGYYEGTGAGASTLGYYFSKLLIEIQYLIEILGGDPNIDFTDYAFSGDLIATCFGESRNRYLGNMLGRGTSIGQALEELASQNKIAEGYETLKGIYRLISEDSRFYEIQSFGERYIVGSFNKI